jgi:hypothetical protein
MMTWVYPYGSKKYASVLVLGLLLFLSACGTNGGTSTGSNGPEVASTPVKQPVTQSCGTVHTLGQHVISADQNLAKSAEDCFWQAYQQCHPATLIYSQASIDTTTLHTFFLKSLNGKCMITDALQHRTLPRSLQPAKNYTCTRLAQQTDGLYFFTCEDEGTVLVPE